MCMWAAALTVALAVRPFATAHKSNFQKNFK